MSNIHDPYGLGFKRMTMVKKKKRKLVIISESKTLSKSGFLSVTRQNEAGIFSNRLNLIAVNLYLNLVHTARHVLGIEI